MKRQRVAHVANVLSALLVEEGVRRVDALRGGQAEDRLTADADRARAVRNALEHLGPLYIKVGQVLSTRPDIVSPAMIAALQDLHEDVMVRPFSEFEPTLVSNLGPRWRDRFRSIETSHPLGAASIAQVYAAVLADGRDVVVKIQRPGVATSTRMDMEILASAVRLLTRRAKEITEIFQPEVMLEVIFTAMRAEIDFTTEAANMKEFAAILEHFEHITVPEVIEVTEQVMIQSRAPGVSIRECTLTDFTAEEREAIGRDIVGMMYRSFMVEGFFHADPHPGNIFVAPGEPATLIDYGMMGRIDRRLSLAYTRMMLAMALNDGESCGRAAIELGRPTTRADIPGFLSDMQRLVPGMAKISLSKIEFGKTFNDMLVIYPRRGIAPNPAIALFGKASANMEGSLRRIAPEMEPFTVFKDVVGKVLRAQFRGLNSQEELLRLTNETYTALRSAPEQIRYLAQNLTTGQFVLRIRDDAILLAQDRADARAKALRRTMWGLAVAAMWWDRRRRPGP